MSTPSATERVGERRKPLRLVLFMPLAAFIGLGPGAAVLTWVSIPRRALLSTVPVLGIAVVTPVTISANQNGDTEQVSAEVLVRWSKQKVPSKTSWNR